MIRTVIVDDEDHVRQNVRSLLHSDFHDLKVVGEAFSVGSAVHIITKYQPDLVLLDIDLSDGSGFNVLEQLKDLEFSVIFITAYNEYAIKAFRYNALDYILKPINVEELNIAVDKVRHAKKGYVTRAELNALLENVNGKDEDKKLVVRNSTSISFVPIRDIIRCEADGNYTTIYLIDGEKIVASKPLKEYASLLPEHQFFRVHQSHLINLNHVTRYANADGGYVIMKDGIEIPLARRRKDEFFAMLERVIS